MSDVRLITRSERWIETLRKKGLQAVTEATKAVDKEFRASVTMTDHSLEELRIMKHPYGKKNPQQIHDPDYQVHKQSGGMLADSVQDPLVTETSDAVVGQFGFFPDLLPACVVNGTPNMRPRPVVHGTLARAAGRAKDIIAGVMRERYAGNITAEMK